MWAANWYFAGTGTTASIGAISASVVARPIAAGLRTPVAATQAAAVQAGASLAGSSIEASVNARIVEAKIG